MSIDAHVSRSYQEELAQRARDHNAILAMDTGTGKTMISAMVIKWRLTQESMNRGNDRSAATKKVSDYSVVMSLNTYNRTGCNIFGPKGSSCRTAALLFSQEYDLCHSRIHWSNGCRWLG